MSQFIDDNVPIKDGIVDTALTRNTATTKPSFLSSIFSKKNKETLHGVNEKLKASTETIAVFGIILAIIAVIILYIITGFVTTNTKTWIYLCGYLLIVVCVIILFLFVNLCLNYQNKLTQKTRL